MKNSDIHHVKSITEFHKLGNLPKPEHPLVSIVDYQCVNFSAKTNEISFVLNFYSVALKRDVNGKFRYGQQQYDFDEGLMSFVAPGQLINVVIDKSPDDKSSGLLLLIHPDFLWNTPLGKNIKRYDFFGYSANEALLLSEKEEIMILSIMQYIKQEYQANIDKFSQNIIVTQIELLLNYSERFYQRQFITRKISSHHLLGRLEEALHRYFEDDDLSNKGLPSVQYISEELNVSANYLTTLIKLLTNQSTQHHIHKKIIEKAKEKLSTTTLTISQIAYGLGFEHPQSFSKLFKQKTNQSPLEFRASFN